MITITALGQMSTRDQVMADAITHGLTTYRMTAFPTGTWFVSADTIMKVVAAARRFASGAGYPFTPDEVGSALADRGYAAQTIDPTAPVTIHTTEGKPPGAIYETEPERRVLLQDAVTFILKLSRHATFPYGRRMIPQAEHNNLVAAIYERARAASVGYGYVISLPDIAYALTDRGYVAEEAVSILPAPAQIRETIYTVPPAQQEMLTFTSQSTARQPGRIYSTTPSPPIPPGGEILPPVVSEKKSDYSWLLIAGLAALAFFVGEEPPRSRRKPSRSGSRGFSGIGGATANCVAWQEVEGKKGGLVWRCLAFAHPCNGHKCEAPMRLPVKQKRQLRICTKTKKVKTQSPRYNLKTVDRCAKYTRVCKEGACIPEPFPKPEPSPGHNLNVEQMTREIAKDMADEQNATQEDVGKTLARDILSRGGIRSYRKGHEREEYREIPLTLKRKTGLPLDEMASEMGMDEAGLMELIRREYPKGKKKQRRFTWTDFKTQAEAQVWNIIDAGMVSGLGAMTFEERHDPHRGTWRHFWHERGKKAKQVTPGQAYILSTRRPNDGDLYLLRATSAEDGRKQIAEGQIQPYHTPERPQHQVVIRYPGRPAPVKTPEQMTFLGLGAEAMMLFPGLKREMVLETEDISTSDDPLEMFLERKGWKMTRVMELQASMSEKAVPDMFTGKTTPLTAGEKELQKDIKQFQTRSAKAESQATFFGRSRRLGGYYGY